MKKPVRLRAHDPDDLTVVSALLQDALVPLADMAYLKDERRFVLAVNRYRWDDPDKPSRTHALLSFQETDGVQSRGLDRSKPNHIYELLSLAYADGIVQAEFSGGGSLRIQVQKLDCLLEDVGEPWPATREPKHDVD